MITVNAIGDNCPIPVIKTKKAMQALTGPEVIEVLVDNEIAVQNVTKMASAQGGTVTSEKVAEKELGRVLILLNQYVDNIKSRMLGVLFWKYVNGEYTWNKFCELSDIVSRLFIDDLEYIDEIAKSPEKKKQYHIYGIPYNIKRLESLGLLELYGEYSRFGDSIFQKEKMFAELTENGEILLELEVRNLH